MWEEPAPHPREAAGQGEAAGWHGTQERCGGGAGGGGPRVSPGRTTHRRGDFGPVGGEFPRLLRTDLMSWAFSLPSVTALMPHQNPSSLCFWSNFLSTCIHTVQASSLLYVCCRRWIAVCCVQWCHPLRRRQWHVSWRFTWCRGRPPWEMEGV